VSTPGVVAKGLKLSKDFVTGNAGDFTRITLRLLADLKELARRDGIEEIELDVGHFNFGAMAFFKRQGFEVLRERLTTHVGTQ
jgi:GNAT superfamily N-acetyltransferase